jgi:transglutaminase-like putative cysteine protease
MLLEVRHLTQYQYEGPVRESVMELWMQPQKNARQRLISFDLTLDPASHHFSYTDVYGNAVYHFDVPQPHELLTIKATSVVETSPPPVLPDALDLGEWDRLKSDFVRGDCFDFLRHHGFTVRTPALDAFIAERDLNDLVRLDPLSALQALCAAIYGAFSYKPGVTESDSPIDVALKLKSGVCQDFAHIMIAVCREWGIPARYVSGYLLTDRSSKGERSAPDATHAWVEVFLPSLRWVGFDPTNNIMAGERHIPVAVGRDYNDVPPSRGVYKGEADSELLVAVAVGRARAAMVEPELIRGSRPTAKEAVRRPADAAYREHQQQQQQQQ